MATVKKYEMGGPVPKTAKKAKASPKKELTASQKIGNLTLRDVKNAGEEALNLSTLGLYGKAKKKVKEVTGMKNGGSVSAGTKGQSKRVGPVDPKGAYTKVQKRTLSGAKGKASLTKDKQLGATKMKTGGCMKCGGKMSKK
jgi:hypothetical protein